VVDGAGAPAPGLHSITQLNNYKSLFGDTLYDDSPGWVSTADDTKRLAAYGLGYKHTELSDSLLVAQVEKAEKAHKPILFFFYHPHWLFTRYKLVQLAEPHPFTSNCFTSTADSKCALPSFSAYIAVRRDLKQAEPRFYTFLSHFRISGAEMQQLMAKVSVDHQSAAQVAQQWIAAHQPELKQWASASS
jgi:glycine betaine/proline transport system substrate-binding protein